MTAKNILLLIPNLGTGGAQKVFRQQLAFLSSHYVVYACVFNLDGALPQDRTDTLHSLNVPGGSNTLLKAWYFCKRVVRLRALKKTLKIDVSISHLEGADYVNVLSRQDDKVICWIHGSKKFDENIEGKTGWLRRKILIPFLMNRSDRIVTVSHAIRHELSREFAIESEKIRTIYNAFDTAQINVEKQAPLPAHFEFLAGAQTIITHCRLSRQKNLFALLMVHAVASKRINSPLVILGDGELRQDLLDFSRNLRLRTYDVWSGTPCGLGFDVYFLGYQENPYRFLSQASLYIMTSGWEGFPLALCEALACGLTVISTDCPTGPREILAPSLDILGSPVSKLLKAEWGLLMPLVPDKNVTVIEYWSDCVVSTIQNTELLLTYKSLGPVRVKQFDLSRTIKDVTETVANLADQS